MSRPDSLERELLHEAIERHGALVYRLAQRVLGNRADAEDVTQEVFIKLLRQRRRSTPPLHHLKAWLARTALNTARNATRSQERRRKREEAWAMTSSRQPFSRNESRPEVEAAIRALPEDLKTPVILHYQEGFKYREIAEVLHCPEGTVATRLSEARRRLREHLQRSGAFAGFPALDAALRGGSEMTVAPDLTTNLQAAIDHELATTSATATAASTSVPAIVGVTATLVVAAVASAGTWWWSSADSNPSIENLSHVGVELALTSAPPESASDPASPSGVSWSPDGSTAASDEQPMATPEGASPPPASPAAGPHSPAIFGWITDDRGQPVEDVQIVVGVNFRRIETTHVVTGGPYYEIPLAQLARTNLFEFNEVRTQHEEKTRELDRVVEDLERSVRDVAQADASRDFTEKKLRVVAAKTKALQRKADVQALKKVERVYQELLDRSSNRETAADWTVVDARDPSPAAARQLGAEQHDKEKIRKEEWKRSWIAEDTISVTLEVSAPGFEARRIGPFAVRDGQSLRVDGELRPADPLTGVVVDRGGHSVEGADVRVLAHEGGQRPAEATRVTTDAQGLFEFDSLAPGAYVVRTSAPGYVADERLVETGSPSVSIRLLSAAGLRLRVTDTTGRVRPKLRAELSLIAASNLPGNTIEDATDADGAVDRVDLEPGLYELRLFTSPHAYPSVVEDVRLEAGRPTELAIVMPAEVRLTGTVATESALPRNSMMIFAYRDAQDSREILSVSKGAQPRTWVEPDGNFAFDETFPPGDYVLGMVARQDGNWGFVQLEPVTLLDQEEVSVDLTHAPLKAGTLRLDLRDPSGATIDRATVFLTRRETHSHSRRQPNDVGRIELTVHPGTFDLRVRAPGYQEARLDALALGSGEILERVWTLEPDHLGTGPQTLDEVLPDGDLNVPQGISLRSLFDLIDAAHPDLVVPTRALLRSGFLERQRFAGQGRLPIRRALEQALDPAQLRWWIDQGRVMVDLWQ